MPILERGMYMIFHLVIHCECGNRANIVPKNTTLEHNGEVYESYSSISDGMVENELFSAKISPDTVNIKCKSCKKEQDLII